MILAIGSTLRLLMWASILQIIIMFIFGVCFVQLVERELASGRDSDTEAHMREHWGSLIQAVYTLYMSITAGVDWREPANALKQVGPLTVFAFCGYITVS